MCTQGGPGYFKVRRKQCGRKFFHIKRHPDVVSKVRRVSDMVTSHVGRGDRVTDHEMSELSRLVATSMPKDSLAWKYGAQPEEGCVCVGR